MVKNRKKTPINTIMDHFSSVNSEDIQSLVNKSKNLNTTKTISKWMRVFNSWAALRGKVCPIFLLSPIDLDKFLDSFYTEVKKRMATSMSQILFQVFMLVLTDV